MSCLEFALLSRSPISLKKKTPERVSETKEEKREHEAKRKTKHNNQQDLLATHTCAHAHAHTLTHTYLLPSFTNSVVFSQLRRSLWKPGTSFLDFIRSFPCVCTHTENTDTHNTMTSLPQCAPSIPALLFSDLKQSTGLKRL